MISTIIIWNGSNLLLNSQKADIIAQTNSRENQRKNPHSEESNLSHGI